MILAALLLASSLVSCGETEPEKENVTETTPADTAPEETEPPETADPYLDNLPRDLNLNGETVVFLYREEVLNEFFTDAMSGDVVNDAQYNSIAETEARLNTDISVIAQPGHLTSVRQSYMDLVINSVKADDDNYDWVDLMLGNTPILMRDGMFMDILQNPYVNVNNPWYLANLDDKLAIDGHLYFLTGDSSLGYLKGAYCIYFNQQLMSNYQLENPYDLVDRGEWTIDKMIEYSSAASQDLDGNGQYTVDDALGFMVHDRLHPIGFWASTLLDMYAQDEEGVWKYVFGSERDVEVLNKLYTLFFATPGSYYSNITNAIDSEVAMYNQLSEKFKSGDVFLMTAQIDDAVSQFRDMEDSYGILPCPKYDTAQEEYRSFSRNNHNAFSMPVTCGNVEAAGAVMEALSSSNYETVVPAYFETALKIKYAHDNDSARMYDLIRGTMVLDFAYVYGNAIGNPADVFYTCISTNDKVASTIKTKKKVLENKLEDYLEAVRENCGH